MKLYKITRLSETLNNLRLVAGWETSDGAASKLCTALKKADKGCEPQREEVEVPTTRTDLVAFLNANAAPAR